MTTLDLHASLDGYALSFVTDEAREMVAVFPTFAAAASALRAAEGTTRLRFGFLQSPYNLKGRSP